MVGEFDLERAVVEQFGRAGAADLVYLVEPDPGEEYHGPAIFEVEPGLQRAEGTFAMAIVLNDDAGRAAEVEMVTVPSVRLGGPPVPDKLAIHWGGHGRACASSLGGRTRS